MVYTAFYHLAQFSHPRLTRCPLGTSKSTNPVYNIFFNKLGDKEEVKQIYEKYLILDL
jgi:hypothetical protein